MKKVKYTLATLMVAAIVAVVLVGCKKDKETTEQAIPKGLLCFKTNEEFSDTYQKVLAMSEAERREWEKQQGFKSYATKCNELFEAFEAKGINSDQDILNFVKENRKYFFIYNDGNEKFLKAHLEDSPFYYIMDERQLFAIGDTTYKVFENYLAKTDMANISAISKLEEGCFEKVFTYTFYADKMTGVTKEYSCDCDPNEVTFRSTESNNRLYVRFYIGSIGIAYIQKCSCRLRPYHRVAGIWYYCSRTITYNFKVQWKYKISAGGNWVYGGNSASDLAGTLSSCIDFDLLNVSSFPDDWIALQFSDFSGWADTPDTPTCSISCPNL